MTDLSALMAEAKVWPAVEAQRLLQRFPEKPARPVLFETGYGPSGLPHIGTFGEVFRTTMVRRAFERLSGWPTRLVCFSDDMDGLRKVPENLPDRERIAVHLQKPLTDIPDPFGEATSYGHHMNGRLKRFLDAFGFEYEFMSATECYRSGVFDATLLKVLERHEAIRDVVLPILGAERRATYSPILPISPKTGRVLQVPLDETHPERGTVVFTDEDGKQEEVPVTGGHCKLQWRADWALRWAALDVDYEMYGKDLIDTVKISAPICRVLGGKPPEGFAYELFLDEVGKKISKSIGNGLTVDEWLTYGPKSSLALFMFQAPKKAKRLFFDVIPKTVDDYETFLAKVPQQTELERVNNPTWHIHEGSPPAGDLPVSYTMLLNLASVAGTDDPAVLWGFIRAYAPAASAERFPRLDELVRLACAYYRDFVAPAKAYRAPTAQERAAMDELLAYLRGVAPDTSGDDLQNEVYEIGKRHGFEPLRNWFKALYEVLLGQSEGPRMGSFFRLYGVANSAALVEKALAGELAAA
ncbi:MAG: lysine--tRNA ligase [Geminicoccaceae bacterium]|nr:MAG: lysine--tRNA ligase [Geminicoccaceae bacterium]